MKRRNGILSSLAAMTFGTLLSWSAPDWASDDLSAWKLPPVPVPSDNPQSDAKIQLGKQLVFDIRLSKNDSIACAHCHVPSAGGGGMTPRAFGHGGELGRWAPSWVNAAYYTSQFWDGRAASLEEQTGALPGHMGPITAPGEMAGNIEAIVKRLNSIPGYLKQFKAVFNEPATPENIAKAIASFERTLIARNAPFQKYVQGDKKAMTDKAIRGFELFRGKAQCAVCHTPPLLSDNRFHNIGVPQVGPLSEDLGRFEITHKNKDRGAFKTPSLYNSATFSFQTHDGAFSTLDELISHYNRGGNPSDPHQSPLIQPLKLNHREMSDLKSFLESLTDQSLNQIVRPTLP